MITINAFLIIGTPNTAKHCVISIAVPSVDLFLLVRVERILQGDVDPAIDLYAKASTKDKDREKILTTLRVC